MIVPQSFAATARPGFCFPVRALWAVSVLLLLTLDGCAKYTPPPPGTASGRQICDTARANIGVRYKMGGALPSTGFDRSGLVQWTFAQYGIPVPRTTGKQVKAGVEVAK